MCVCVMKGGEKVYAASMILYHFGKSCSKICIPQERHQAVTVITDVLLGMFFLLTKWLCISGGTIQNHGLCQSTGID